MKHIVRSFIDAEHKTVPFYPDGEFLVVRTANVRNGCLRLEKAKYTDSDGFKNWTVRGLPEEGDIVFTREAPAGEACVVPAGVSLCLGQRTVLFKINSSLAHSQYVLHALYGGLGQEFIQKLSQGTTVAHFNMGDISNIPILFPPREEQVDISVNVEGRLLSVDITSQKVIESIELLLEHRSALISAAVTGKIDVSGEVA